MKKKLLFRFGILFGLIPLIGGLVIFLLWWIERAWYASDDIDYEIAGLRWIGISFFLALTGLVLMTVFAHQNYPQFKLRSVIGFSTVIINIPVLLFILLEVADIGSRAYFKITNNSPDQISVTIKTSYMQRVIHNLDSGESSVECFDPKYDPYDSDLRDMDTIFVNIESSTFSRRDTLGYGLCQEECIHWAINERLEIYPKTAREYIDLKYD